MSTKSPDDGEQSYVVVSPHGSRIDYVLFLIIDCLLFLIKVKERLTLLG